MKTIVLAAHIFTHTIGLFLITTLLCSTGCSGDGMVDVEGTVTWNGQPLPTGSIKFFHGEQIPAGVGKVEEGKFKFRSKPMGKVRVEITAIKKFLPAERDDESNNTNPQYLPTRYNLESILTAEITAQGAKDLKFDLVANPRK